MDRSMSARPRRPRATRLAISLLALMALAGCGTAATPPAGVGGGAGASASPVGAPGTASGGGTVEGSLTTSGALDATWTWASPDSVNSSSPPLASLSFTIGSEKGAFGHVEVRADGTITFLSAKLPQGPFTGTGGKLTMGASGYPCSMTIDASLAGGGGATLKVVGTLTTKGSLVKEDTYILEC